MSNNKNICDICVADKSKCNDCIDNPKYRDYPKRSMFMGYVPLCPRGHQDCINDPAYIKYHYPKWYKELYGDKTPEEALEECLMAVEEDPEGKFCCYDDEDK